MAAPRGKRRSSRSDAACSIERSLGVLGDGWTLLILRDATMGSTRFVEFQRSLGIAPDVLTGRLATLVEAGVLARAPYQDAGARSRFEYRLTPAGRKLQVMLMALQEWGDEHLPRPEGPSLLRRHRRTDRPVHVGLVDDTGRQIDLDDLTIVPPDASPADDT